ncbi:MAG: GNAT family N-acetyltransferase [Thermoleophilaceae bacterium]
MTDPRDPVPLQREHRTAGFDCGRPELDTWLERHALAAHRSGSARVFVSIADDGRIAGYYALAVAQVSHRDATERAVKGMPAAPIPAALLARLAVDSSLQGRGLGERLLRDAMLRVLGAAESIGIRVLLVHAKDPAAREFYERYDFEPSPTDPLHLLLLLKDVRAALSP